MKSIMKILRIIKYIFIVFSIIFSFLFIMIRGSYELQLPGWKAEIEETRRSVLLVKDISNEDVLGEALKLNQEIKTYHVYNSMWWSDIFVPDSINDIKTISLIERVVEVKE